MIFKTLHPQRATIYSMFYGVSTHQAFFSMKKEKIKQPVLESLKFRLILVIQYVCAFSELFQKT